MRKTELLFTLVATILLGIVGCDVKPSPPTVGGQRIQQIEVGSDSEETQAVRDYVQARLAYRHALDVLTHYYRRAGDATKLRWARRESENLQQAQTFRFEGVDVELPAGQRIDVADERALVEQTIAAREQWQTELQDLLDYYRQQEMDAKAAAVRNIQERFDPIRTYAYYIEAELPSPDHEPVAVIPAADELYERALRLHMRTRRIPLVTDYADQRQALRLFQELVAEYPDSTKAALAAYYIGEIYKDYFDEYVRAAKWYERAISWDPELDQPVRFEMATVYDYYLREPEEALKYYRASLVHDPERTFNRQHARKRIMLLREKLGE